MARNGRLSSSRQSPGERSTGSRPQRTRRVSRPVLPLGGHKPVRPSRRPPPVLVRNEMVREMTSPSKKGQNRRRYDVALSIPGAEVRLPSMPQVQIGWRLLSGLLVIALGALLYFAWTAPIFQVGVVEVNGLQRVTLEEINTHLGLAGATIFTINPNEVHASLTRAFPEMSAITVEVTLPAQVVVTVAERVPVLHWKEDLEEAWIDASGVLFPPLGDSSGLPVIYGDLPFKTTVLDEGGEAQRSISPELVDDILALKSFAPADTAIYYEADYGLGWRDQRGWDVFFGMSRPGGDQMDMKLRVYAALIERLEQEGIGPKFISVEHVHAPYYRTER